MNIKKIFSSLILSAVFISVALINSSVLAKEQNVSLTISPVIEEITVKAGDKYSNRISLKNESDEEIDFTVKIENFGSDNEEGQSTFYTNDQNVPYALASWITTDIKNFTLKPNETKDVNYIIEVPINTASGGRYAAIIFSGKPIQDNNGKTQISTINEIGSLLLVNVDGAGINYSGAIEDFKSNKYFYSYDQVEFISRIANNGNIHFKPKGVISIYNMFGKKVTSITFNEDKNNILPDTIRKFENNWQQKSSLGWYKAVLDIDCGGKQLTKTISFMIMPWKEVSIIVLVIALIIVLFTKKKK